MTNQSQNDADGNVWFVQRRNERIRKHQPISRCFTVQGAVRKKRPLVLVHARLTTPNLFGVKHVHAFTSIIFELKSSEIAVNSSCKWLENFGSSGLVYYPATTPLNWQRFDSVGGDIRMADIDPVGPATSSSHILLLYLTILIPWWEWKLQLTSRWGERECCTGLRTQRFACYGAVSTWCRL